MTSEVSPQWNKKQAKVIKTLLRKKKSAERLSNVRKLYPLLLPEYDYKDEKQMQKGREVFLECWEFLLSEVNNAQLCDRAVFYRSILAISRHAEFNPKTISIDKEKNLNVSEDHYKSLEIQHRLLADTTAFCLDRMSKDRNQAIFSEFALKMIVLGFFWFSDLADVILDAIWSEDQATSSAKKDKQLLAMVRKQANAAISEPTKGEIKFSTLAERMHVVGVQFSSSHPLQLKKNRKEWLRRFLHKGGTFHVMVKHLIDTVVSIAGSAACIDWDQLYGYPQFLHAVAYQLKHRVPVRQWSKSSLACTVSLMRNPNVISIFIHLLYSKTNVHDSMTTLRTIDILGQWLEFVAKLSADNRLPDAFDFDHFLEGISVMLDSEHLMVLNRATILVFDDLGLFKPEYRVAAICMLLKKFRRLFLHWNTEQRAFYQHILLYKIKRHPLEYKAIKDKAEREHQLETDKALYKDMMSLVSEVKEAVGWEQRKAEARKVFQDELRQHQRALEVLANVKVVRKEPPPEKPKGFSGLAAARGGKGGTGAKKKLQPDEPDTQKGKEKDKEKEDTNNKSSKKKGGKDKDKNKEKDKNDVEGDSENTKKRKDRKKKKGENGCGVEEEKAKEEREEEENSGKCEADDNNNTTNKTKGGKKNKKKSSGQKDQEDKEEEQEEEEEEKEEEGGEKAEENEAKPKKKPKKKSPSGDDSTSDPKESKKGAEGKGTPKTKRKGKKKAPSPDDNNNNNNSKKNSADNDKKKWSNKTKEKDKKKGTKGPPKEKNKGNDNAEQQGEGGDSPKKGSSSPSSSLLEVSSSKKNKKTTTGRTRSNSKRKGSTGDRSTTSGGNKSSSKKKRGVGGEGSEQSSENLPTSETLPEDDARVSGDNDTGGKDSENENTNTSNKSKKTKGTKGAKSSSPSTGASSPLPGKKKKGTKIATKGTRQREGASSSPSPARLAPPMSSDPPSKNKKLTERESDQFATALELYALRALNEFHELKRKHAAWKDQVTEKQVLKFPELISMLEQHMKGRAIGGGEYMMMAQNAKDTDGGGGGRGAPAGVLVDPDTGLPASAEKKDKKDMKKRLRNWGRK